MQGSLVGFCWRLRGNQSPKNHAWFLFVAKQFCLIVESFAILIVSKDSLYLELFNFFPPLSTQQRSSPSLLLSFRSILKMRTSFLILLCVTFAHAGFWIEFPFPSNRSTVPWATCDGKPTKNESLACGVTHDYCLRQSKGYNDWQLLNWDDFVPQFATWLAPWLALLSQLPYETKDGITNLMSLLLVLGSPCLATYSLALMALNARWMNRSFRLLHQRSQDVSLRPQRPEYHDALDSIRQICIESQHIPLGVTLGHHHDFSQMVVRPRNAETWKDLKNEIFKTKREKTLSLWMSLAWVVILQFLSIVQFFTTATTDNNSVILGLAVNSLWLWMVPLVWGYVLVGSQNFARSIGDAFQTLHAHDMTIPGSKDISVSGESTPTGVDTKAYDDDSTLALSKGYRDGEHHKSWTKVLVDRTDARHWYKSHTFLGFLIAGWNRQSGPLFVFARVRSHRIVCQHILDALYQLLRRQQEKKTVHGGPWNESNFEENLDGTAEQTALYVLPRLKHQFVNLNHTVESNPLGISLDDKYEAYGPKTDFNIHTGAPEGIAKDFAIASFAGLFLQWATTGSAIVIAYK